MDPSAVGEVSKRRSAKRQLSKEAKQANGSGSSNKVARTASFETKKGEKNKPQQWGPDEDKLLKAAVKKYGEKDFNKIAEMVPGRTHLQCVQRWRKALKPGLVKGTWNEKEDEVLLGMINHHIKVEKNIATLNWQDVANKIPGRNAKQCRERWFLNLDPSIKRGPWTEEEDQLLLELSEKHNCRWSIIAKFIPGRTENYVKTRYHSLKRQEAKRKPWTVAEDETLVRAVLLSPDDYTNAVEALPERPRMTLKKRYAMLAKEKPEFIEEVKKNLSSVFVPKFHAPAPSLVMLGADKTLLRAGVSDGTIAPPPPAAVNGTAKSLLPQGQEKVLRASGDSTNSLLGGGLGLVDTRMTPALVRFQSLSGLRTDLGSSDQLDPSQGGARTGAGSPLAALPSLMMVNGWVPQAKSEPKIELSRETSAQNLLTANAPPTQPPESSTERPSKSLTSYGSNSSWGGELNGNDRSLLTSSSGDLASMISSDDLFKNSGMVNSRVKKLLNKQSSSLSLGGPSTELGKFLQNL